MIHSFLKPGGKLTRTDNTAIRFTQQTNLSNSLTLRDMLIIVWKVWQSAGDVLHYTISKETEMVKCFFLVDDYTQYWTQGLL